MSLPDFAYSVYIINVGGIKTLTMDSMSTPTPYTFASIPSGFHNIAITSFGYTGTGQRYKLSCTSFPLTVTIPANGRDIITIQVNSASLQL